MKSLRLAVHMLANVTGYLVVLAILIIFREQESFICTKNLYHVSVHLGPPPEARKTRWNPTSEDVDHVAP